MAKIFKLATGLFCITTVTGLILGSIYTMTLEPIRKVKEKIKMEALVETLPEASSFEGIDSQQSQSVIKEVNRGSSGGKIVGYNITVTPKGYGGPLEMVVGIDKNGRLIGIKILNHNETPGLGANADEPAFADQFHEKNVEKIVVTTTPPTVDNEIQALSGATITSEAIASGVNRALEYWANNLKGEENN